MGCRLQNGRRDRPSLMVAVSLALFLAGAALAGCGGTAAPAKTAAQGGPGGAGTSAASSGASSGATNLTLAQLAAYTKPNLQQVLLAQARREGQLVYYATNTWMASALVRAFEKAYPGIHVQVYRGSGVAVTTRVLQEAAAHHPEADVVDNLPVNIKIMAGRGLIQTVKSPVFAGAYPASALMKGPGGVQAAEGYEIGISLGYNTNLVPPAEAPHTLQDLLNPRWKGKIDIAGTTTGVQWIGVALQAKGMSYIQALQKQQLRVQEVSGAALAQMVASGQVALSPTIFSSNVHVLRGKGDPIAWAPLPPVVVNRDFSALLAQAPHPAAALLFWDYMHSKAGQQVVEQGGLNSGRTDLTAASANYQKVDPQYEYPQATYLQKYKQWEQIMNHDFMGR